MACTSLNQSSSSQSSRFHLMSGDRSEDACNVDEHVKLETGTDAMLDNVRKLIVDLFVDDDHHSSSFHLNEDTAVEQTAGLLSTKDANHHSNNPEVKQDGDSTARERLLETKLARVLVTLAGEQDNLRLAANAGNALLEELGAAREEVDVLQDELEAAQLERDQAVREMQRLRDQNAALETEVQRYNAPYGSWNSGPQNTLSHIYQTQQQRRPSLTSCESFSRTDSCKWCASRVVEVTQLEQCIDELRRRCLELELASDHDQQRQRELTEAITQLQQRSKEQSLETVRAQEDLEFVTLQLEQQIQEVESVQAVRDTLRRTARRLEAENEELEARLAARDELIEKLEIGKIRAATQLQVAENRTTSAQAVTKRVTKTLEQLQKQLEHALQQQQGGRDRREVDVEFCEKEAEDMEQLLQDATREVAALRLENRVLRRQHSSEANSDGSWMRGRRRKTLCMGSPAMTAADVLALGSREPKRDGTASFSSKSGSDMEPTTSSNFQLLPLEIEIIAPLAKAAGLLSGNGNKRRKMSLELNWVDKTATIIDDTAAAFDEKPRSVYVLTESEHHVMHVDENQVRGLRHNEMKSFATASSAVKHHAALLHLSHVNNHCNNSNVRVSGSDGKEAARLPAVGDSECPRVRELSIEELERDATELPPTSPLYLGLSFIACATAATAASLLVRR